MRQAMKKWLSRHQITFSADAANSICSSLGLDGEKVDECLGLCYQLEKGNINEADFTGGLCVLTGKKPEEVMEVLRDIKGTRPKMTWDELDKKAIALYIKRHGREAYESGKIGETLERIKQRAEEYDPVFLSRHPELKGKSITVYHDPLVGDDWAVVNNETGEVIEIFNEELMGVLKGMKTEAVPEAELIADLKRGAEYEGRFWFGPYAYTRFRFAEKDAPIHKMIATARENYNALREKIGFEPVTDWTKRPDDTLEKRLREILKGKKPEDKLAIACYNALANHGIAVHYTILGKMVRRYYKPEITDQQVLSCLSRNKDLFRRLEDYPGAYFLAGKKEGQTYPEIGEVSDPKKD